MSPLSSIQPGLTSSGLLRRRALLLGLLAVLVPLALLLGLQYRWLSRLQQTSAIAERAELSNYLEAVSSEIEFYYRTQAERSLNIPAYLMKERRSEKLGYFLASKSSEAARSVFAVRYVDKQNWGNLLAYDPIKKTVGPPTDPETFQAITLALSPWRVLAYQGAPVPSHTMTVDQMDSDNVIILNPITDDALQLLGMAGLVVDTHYFESVILPEAIEKSLLRFFPERRDQEDLVITVRDGAGRLVFGGDEKEEEAEEVTAGVPFVFTDWRLGLGSRRATAEEWARSNFMINLSLSILLTGVLLGGLTFAFRTASRELRLSQMKSDFVSNVSHELRTPIASIRVFAEFLRLGRVRDVEKSREYGEFIETESRRLTQLINNILDFSKIESGAKTYQLEEVRIEEVVEESLANLSISLGHRGFDLEFEKSDDSLPPLPLDRRAMTQALANLVDNAVKYSGESTSIRVGLARTPTDVVISVTDRGMGISKSEQKKIFERFHRAGTSLVHDVRGSGLGLSIVSHIVKAHGGRVIVESELGQGSTFSILLPVQRASRPAALAVATQEGMEN